MYQNFCGVQALGFRAEIAYGFSFVLLETSILKPHPLVWSKITFHLQ